MPGSSPAGAAPSFSAVPGDRESTFPERFDFLAFVPGSDDLLLSNLRRFYLWSLSQNRLIDLGQVDHLPTGPFAFNAAGDAILFATMGTTTSYRLERSRSGRVKMVHQPINPANADDFPAVLKVMGAEGYRLMTEIADDSLSQAPTARRLMTPTLSERGAHVTAATVRVDPTRQTDLQTAVGTAQGEVFEGNSMALTYEDPLKGHASAVQQVALSPSGHKLASIDREGGLIVWETYALPPRLGWDYPVDFRFVKSLAFDALRDRIAVGGFRGELAVTFAEGSPRYAQLPREDTISAVRFDLEGRVVAAADGKVYRWDLEADRVEEILAIDGWQGLWERARERFAGRILPPLFALNPTATTLALVEPGGTGGQLWDLREGRKLRSFEVPDQRMVSLALDATDDRVAIGLSDGGVRLWSKELASRGMELEPQVYNATSLAFGLKSPGLERITSDLYFRLAASNGNERVEIYRGVLDVRTGPALVASSGLTGALGFSPDGSILASVSPGEVRLWDVASSQELGALWLPDRRVAIPGGPPAPEVRAASPFLFRPDHQQLVTAGPHGLRFWNLDEEAWRRIACAVANRNLTEDEWRNFLGEEIPYRRTCPDLPAADHAAVARESS